MDNKISNQNQKKKFKTQNSQFSLQKVILKASQQKLFSKLLIQYSSKFKNKSLFNSYKKDINNKYIQELKSPLIYNPQEALTHRQKFRKKVLMLLNNQLQIDYFERKKSSNGKYQLTFKGNPIDDSKNNKPKKEFQIFKDFNQKKFKQSYLNMFEDKLELKHQKFFRQKQYRLKTTGCVTEDILNIPYKFESKKAQQKQTTLKKSEIKQSSKIIPLLIQKPKSNFKLKPHLQKLQIGKKISNIDDIKIAHKMKLIGGYSTKIPNETLLLTKQSISKYFKILYQREHRLIDFMQLKPALNLPQYKALCTRLNLMPNDHITFMVFLYYDFNNDGFICQNDLRRINELAINKNNSLILEDVKMIKKKAESFNYEETLQTKYIQLYKLPQITETTYFIWKKQNEKQILYNNQQKVSKIPNFSSKSTKNNTIQTKINAQNQQEEYLNSKKQIKQKNQDHQKIMQKQIKMKINSFNPSILQNESAQVRKYLLSIKKKKMYMNFQIFQNLYLHNQNKSISKPFLWYDIMDKIASVRFQGLRYQN